MKEQNALNTNPIEINSLYEYNEDGKPTYYVESGYEYWCEYDEEGRLIKETMRKLKKNNMRFVTTCNKQGNN